MKKRACLALALVLVMLLSVGCGLLPAKEQTFTRDGLTITLTNRFQEGEREGYTAYFKSTQVLVLALKEEKSLFAERGMEVDLDGYTQLVMDANGQEGQPEHQGGLTYFTYDYATGGEEYRYFTAAYEGDDAFWVVQFACQKSKYESLEETILKYAQSVQV